MARLRETPLTLIDRDGDTLTLNSFTGDDYATTHYMSVRSQRYGTQPVSLEPAQLEDLGNHLLAHGNRIAPRHASPAPYTSWTHTDVDGDMLAVELLDRVTEDPYHEVYITAQGSFADGMPVTVHLDHAALLETGLHLLALSKAAAKAASNG